MANRPITLRLIVPRLIPQAIACPRLPEGCKPTVELRPRPAGLPPCFEMESALPRKSVTPIATRASPNPRHDQIGVRRRALTSLRDKRRVHHLGIPDAG